MTEPLLLRVREAAARLSIGRDTAYALVRTGRLRSISIGARRLVPVTELAAFVARETEGGDRVNDKGGGNGSRPPTDTGKSRA